MTLEFKIVVKNKLLLFIFCLGNVLLIVGQEVGQTERLISPEINPDNTITFRIHAPKATLVEVSGNWMPMVQLLCLIMLASIQT